MIGSRVKYINQKHKNDIYRFGIDNYRRKYQYYACGGGESVKIQRRLQMSSRQELYQ